MSKLNRLPRWLERKYNALWSEFHNKPFRREEAVRVLEQKTRDNREDVPVFLSELRKAGLLNIESDPEDLRRSIYSLRSLPEVIREIFDAEGSSLGRNEIEAILKKAADLIRTRVDYKFILVLLFLKRISDKWELEYDKEYKKARDDGLDEKQAGEEAKKSAYHDFDIPEEYLWENIRKDLGSLPEKFSRALKVIAERNPDLKDAIDNLDFIQFASNRENFEILRQLVELFSEKKLYHVSSDILGDAYEWILRYFAPQKAKEGEVYTAREVITLMVEILDPCPGKSVYDPAAGSNGMLILSYKYVEKTYGKTGTERLFLFAQEANQRTLALGRMNLYIHDIKNVYSASGDTLLYPKFKEKDDTKKFAIVLANPPWNQDGYDEDVLKKGDIWQKRFKYGFSPRQSADWAWIQHMVASADEKTGKVGIVIDNGCLFRGGKEKNIRSRMIEDDLIESIILLPEKLFYNTGAPGAIIILNKDKQEKRKGKILFINASQEYIQHPEVRKLNKLDRENIDKIVGVYKDFQFIEGFADTVPIAKIRNNDYNLNVTLYVFPQEITEDINIEKEWQELHRLEDELKQTEKRISDFLNEIK
jgi:type I restriction enzyme M protein